MESNMLKNMTSRLGIRQLLLMALIITFIILAGCTSSYNSQKKWNRTPPSTGNNRCGCLLNPAIDHGLKLYHQPIYALQA